MLGQEVGCTAAVNSPNATPNLRDRGPGGAWGQQSLSGSHSSGCKISQMCSVVAKRLDLVTGIQKSNNVISKSRFGVSREKLEAPATLGLCFCLATLSRAEKWRPWRQPWAPQFPTVPTAPACLLATHCPPPGSESVPPWLSQWTSSVLSYLTAPGFLSSKKTHASRTCPSMLKGKASGCPMTQGAWVCHRGAGAWLPHEWGLPCRAGGPHLGHTQSSPYKQTHRGLWGMKMEQDKEERGLLAFLGHRQLCGTRVLNDLSRETAM